MLILAIFQITPMITVKSQEGGETLKRYKGDIRDHLRETFSKKIRNYLIMLVFYYIGDLILFILLLFLFILNT